ncbi:MAG: lipid-transfer protein [Pseudomonadota bacterium]
MGARTFIAGVGMTQFVKPGTSPDYDEMGATAIDLALADCGLSYTDVQEAYAGYVYGDSTSGQRAVYRAGLTGIPIINVNNNCSTGSTALYLARKAVASGAVDCALAVGFEQMRRGALGDVYEDRPSPMQQFLDAMDAIEGSSEAPMALRLFGGAGAEWQRRYGVLDETFAKISVKARAHAEHNDKALFRTQVSIEEVLESPKMHGPLTRLQCCPPTCGGGAAIVVSEAFMKKHGLTRCVELKAQAMTTDDPATFDSGSPAQIVGYGMSAKAAADVYETAGVGPEDVDVVELHDCFTANELISYEALGLAPEGGAEKFIADGDNTYGGRVVTNPSGGLLSKGHPLGATGLAQCTELVMQLRGEAGVRQVGGAKTALQHNVGLGGACVVGLYQI